MKIHSLAQGDIRTGVICTGAAARQVRQANLAFRFVLDTCGGQRGPKTHFACLSLF